MRVAHLSWNGQVGGIQRLVHDLALAQRRQEIDVQLILGQAGGPFSDDLRDEGIPVSDLALRSGVDVRPGVVSRGRRLLEAVDVVHMHGFNLGFERLLAGRDRAVVYTEHGQFALGRRLGVSGRMKRLALRAFLRRRAEVITAVSEHTAATMRSVYGLNADRVRVVPNGINCVGDLVERADRPDRRMTVAFVGRLVPFKRVDRLIRAASLIDDGSALRIVIAGSGPLEADLKALAASVGADPAIEFAGTVTDVPALLSGADVVVQPSEDEPFGLVILEAACRGCLPIAFSDGGGALEVMPPDGIVVKDERELAGALTDLAGGQPPSEEARRERADWVRRTFPIERSAEAYADLYRLALDGGTR